MAFLVDLVSVFSGVFSVEEKTFIGSYIGKCQGRNEFVVERGLLTIEETIKVKVVRPATEEESRSLVRTKNRIINDYAILFLNLEDLDKEYQSFRIEEDLKQTYNDDFIFQIGEKMFIGTYIGTESEHKKFIVEGGILVTDQYEKVEVVRRATLDEAFSIMQTKIKMDKKEPVRFLNIKEVKAINSQYLVG